MAVRLQYFEKTASIMFAGWENFEESPVLNELAIDALPNCFGKS